MLLSQPGRPATLPPAFRKCFECAAPAQVIECLAEEPDQRYGEWQSVSQAFEAQEGLQQFVLALRHRFRSSIEMVYCLEHTGLDRKWLSGLMREHREKDTLFIPLVEDGYQSRVNERVPAPKTIADFPRMKISGRTPTLHLTGKAGLRKAGGVFLLPPEDSRGTHWPSQWKQCYRCAERAMVLLSVDVDPRRVHEHYRQMSAVGDVIGFRSFLQTNLELPCCSRHFSFRQWGDLPTTFLADPLQDQSRGTGVVVM